jgi:uncharacterized membrane protein YuzA (DUF378 family)
LKRANYICTKLTMSRDLYKAAKGGVNLMKSFQGLTLVSLILVIIGALNWGLIGLLQLDLVALLFGGQDTLLSRLVYTVVGLAGLQLLTLFRKK